MHSTLKIKTNIILILSWLIISLIAFILINPYPYLFLYIGIILGILCGILQNLSFNNLKEEYKNAKSAIEIRNILKRTKAGKYYLIIFWGSAIVFLFLGIYLNQIIGFVVGYFSMALIRDIFTLKVIIKLNKK